MGTLFWFVILYWAISVGIGLWAAMRNDRLLRGAQGSKPEKTLVPVEATYG